MPRKRFELAVIGTSIVCIIGYAGVGLVSTGDRVANADRTLNVVVSHQNTLNATFSDINSQLGALTANATFSPRDAVALVDRSVASSELAGKTINADDASLVAAQRELRSDRWLTMLGSSNLDREADRIAALNSQSTAGDLEAARSTLATMKAAVDQASEQSSAPPLPADLVQLTKDLRAFVNDYGKKLDAQLARDDEGAAASQASVDADLSRIATYSIDSIGTQIDDFYRPMIARFNSEIAAATA